VREKCHDFLRFWCSWNSDSFLNKCSVEHWPFYSTFHTKLLKFFLYYWANWEWTAQLLCAISTFPGEQKAAQVILPVVTTAIFISKVIRVDCGFLMNEIFSTNKSYAVSWLTGFHPNVYTFKHHVSGFGFRCTHIHIRQTTCTYPWYNYNV